MRHAGAPARLSLLIALLLGMCASALAVSPTTPVRATGTDNWNQTGDPIVPRDTHATADVTAVGLHGGKVLLIGGQGGQGGQSSSVLNEAELYDPTSGQFTASGAGTLNEARYQHAAVELPNGNVLVSGGTGNGTNAKASAEIWNAGSGTWSSTGAMNTPRLGHLLFVLPNGKAIAIGGKTTISGSPLTSTEIYDPATSTWSAGAATAQAVGATVQITNGQLLRVYPSGAAEVDYNGAGWSAVGSLTTPRANFTLKALPGNGAVVLGGYGEGGTTDGAKRMEVYDGRLATWTLGKSLYDGRADATANLLPDGTLLIFGGKTGTAQDARPVLTFEKLDLTTNAATRTTPTQDDVLNPATIAMANADVLSIGFREPGTNQQHHSVRYAAPAARALLTMNPTPIKILPQGVNKIGFAIVTVASIGGSPVTVGTPTMQGNGTVFTSFGTDCVNKTLSQGQSCISFIQFQPTAAISYSAALMVPSNATGGTITVPVYGTGSSGISPPGMEFGAKAVGALASHTVTGIPVTFTNIVSAGFGTSISVSTASISVGNTDFTIASDQCTGQTLPFGASCVVTVAFHPQGAGEKNGSVLFQLSDGSNKQMNVHGVGTNQSYPVATFSSGSSVYFGIVNIGSNGQYRGYQQIHVTNTGQAAFTHTANTSISGADAADFFLGYDFCVTTIQPGQSCDLRFSFIPKTGSPGTRTAVFNFNYTDAQNQPYNSTIALQAKAADSSVATTIMSVDHSFDGFGTVAVGNVSTLTFIVRNWGNTAFTVSSVGLDAFSINNTDFLTGTECNGVTLQPGGQLNGFCSVTVTFRPTRAGLRTAVFNASAGSGVSGLNIASLFGSATGVGTPALTSIAAGSLVTYATEQPVALGTSLIASVQQIQLVEVLNTGTGVIGGNAGVISNDGGTLLSENGAGIIASGGGNIIASGGGNLISQDGGGLITDNGGGFTGHTGSVFTPRIGVQPHVVASTHYVGDLSQSTCQNVTKLEPGDSCTIAVRFAPVSAGSKPATFTLALNTINTTHNSTMTVAATLPLSGDGVVAPKITSVPVAGGGAAAGSSLTVTGTGFDAGTKAYFGIPGGPGGITPTSFTATSLTLTTPALNPGDYDVTAVTANGRASNVGRYHVLPANFTPMLTPHATAPPMMGGAPPPIPTHHPTVPPISGGSMPTPLSQPGRH